MCNCLETPTIFVLQFSEGFATWACGYTRRTTAACTTTRGPSPNTNTNPAVPPRYVSRKRCGPMIPRLPQTGAWKAEGSDRPQGKWLSSNEPRHDIRTCTHNAPHCRSTAVGSIDRDVRFCLEGRWSINHTHLQSVELAGCEGSLLVVLSFLRRRSCHTTCCMNCMCCYQINNNRLLL